MRKLFSSESVTIGHPDKICDQISDAVLDELLSQDQNSRVACDVAVNTGMVLVMGEITTEGYADINDIARRVIREIGYTKGEFGFDADSCAVMTSIDKQSPDISIGVTESEEYKKSGDIRDLVGAGDQGMMFGFASSDTEELMPMPIQLAHRLTDMLARTRLTGKLDYLRPDGKSQVTVLYEDGKPRSIDTVVLATQHSEEVSHPRLCRDLIELVRAEIPKNLLTNETKFFINPTGRFVVGGPRGDSGLTGRKIIVDTYGGFAPHGGGAFSGKDPTKVDRSAAYYVRYAAKNVVAAGLADACEIQVAYAIGKAHPVSVYVDTRGTGKVSDELIAGAVKEVFDMRPFSIIEELGLRNPVYYRTAKNGHFGKSDFAWERLDRTEKLKEAVKRLK